MADRIRELENALQLAAASTVTAIDRIHLMHPVVEAAREVKRCMEACVDGEWSPVRAKALVRAERTLAEFVGAYEQVIARRS